MVSVKKSIFSSYLLPKDNDNAYKSKAVEIVTKGEIDFCTLITGFTTFINFR